MALYKLITYLLLVVPIVAVQSLQDELKRAKRQIEEQQRFHETQTKEVKHLTQTKQELEVERDELQSELNAYKNGMDTEHACSNLEGRDVRMNVLIKIEEL